MKASLFSLNSSGMKANVVWVAFCAAILMVIVPNLGLWPSITQDEVQIIDLGRVFLSPSTDWSTGWLVHDSIPLIGSSYLGNLLQELAFRLFAHSNTGPRLSALVGAIIAASVLLAWLARRGTPRWAAVVISLVFLLDPIFNSSYRQGRVDSWAFAVCIGACWLLQVAKHQKVKGQKYDLTLFTAGLLTGMAPFVWPTTLALMPLVFLETYYVIKSTSDESVETWQKSLLTVVWPFLLGAVISLLGFITPILVEWEAHMISLKASIHIQNVAAVIQRSIFDMYMLYDPILLPAVVSALILRRELGLIIAMSLALVMIFQTMVYPMRILYLLPYCMAMLGGGFSVLSRQTQKSVFKFSFLFMTCALLAWNAGVTLVKRPVIAHFQKHLRSPDQFETKLEKVIGTGPFKVLTTEWDVYYGARALGWKLYKPFGRIYHTSEEFNTFMQDMDYVLFRNEMSFMKPVKLDRLNANGFELLSTIQFPSSQSVDVKFGPIAFDAPGQLYQDLMVFKNGREEE